MSGRAIALPLGSANRSRVPTREERLDALRDRKRLVDCGLPEGFELVWREPRQTVMDGLAVRAICLAYRCSKTHEVLYFTARYEDRIPNDLQLRWAVRDFTRQLQEAGYDVAEAEMELGPVRVARLRWAQ